MTKIEWCDTVWNPISGCTRVSSGCDNCYAVRMTRRLEAMGHDKYKGLVNAGKKHFNGEVKFHRSELNKPLQWKKPRVIFVNSMSDLFHEKVKFEWIDQIFEVMYKASHHQFIILTKRPHILLENFEKYYHPKWPFPNVWIGVSVEDQDTADERISMLAKIPAKHKLISIEPMIGPVDITNNGINNGYSVPTDYTSDGIGIEWTDPGDSFIGVNWVIAGGESGPNARPVHPDWIRSIRDQCASAEVPFFFKQWGEYLPLEFDAQPPFRFFSHDPSDLIDGHAIDVEDPKTGGPGKHEKYRFMDAMDSITLCMETKSSQCDFLKVGKSNLKPVIDYKYHLQNPAKELLN